jgi:hypothetical protein
VVAFALSALDAAPPLDVLLALALVLEAFELPESEAAAVPEAPEPPAPVLSEPVSPEEAASLPLAEAAPLSAESSEALQLRSTAGQRNPSSAIRSKAKFLMNTS